MEPPLPAPRGFIFWPWVLMRAFWFIVLVLPAAALGVFIGSFALFQTPVVGLQWLAFGLAAAYLGWLAGRQVWKVARGTAVYPEKLMQDELTATAVVFCLFALALAIVWPTFGDLVRKSAEGANKGNLGLLRQDLEDYRKAHEGRVPAALDELGRGRQHAFNLWSYKAGTNHSKTTAWFPATGAPSADTGQWAYVVDPSSGARLYIDCTHTDSRGTHWTAY